MNASRSTNSSSVDSTGRQDISQSLMYRIATTDDCDQLATLINNAYRGPLSLQGWTNEDALIPSPRINRNALYDMIHHGRCVILMFFGISDQTLTGCIHLRPPPRSKKVDFRQKIEN